MIRKLNLGLLASLPLLALLFGVLCIRMASATTYAGQCPNVIGSVNVCPAGYHYRYYNTNGSASSFPTCHTGTYTYGPASYQQCCQYEAWWVECVNDADPNIVLAAQYGPVEYFQSRDYTTCQGTGRCGSGTSV